MASVLFAFLDDIYVLSSPERTRVIYDLLATTLRERAGIQLHTGKTRNWNCAGECPVDMAELGPDVWNPLGIKILGTPVGHDEFVVNFLEERLAEERKLWDAIPSIPDLQCSWQVLLQCAGPRCHHLLRTVPPRQCAGYAHGALFWDAAHDGSTVGEDPRKPNAGRDGTQHHHSTHEDGWSRFEVSREDGGQVHSGLHGLTRLPMLQQRLPRLTGQVMHHLSHPDALGCMGELQESVSRLDREGFVRSSLLGDVADEVPDLDLL